MLYRVLALSLLNFATPAVMAQEDAKADRCRALAAELYTRARQDGESLSRRKDNIALNGDRDQISFTAMTEKAQADLKAAEAIRTQYGDQPPSPQMATHVAGLTPVTLNLEAELCKPQLSDLNVSQ